MPQPSSVSTREHGAYVTKNSIFSRSPLGIEVKQTPNYYKSFYKLLDSLIEDVIFRCFSF